MAKSFAKAFYGSKAWLQCRASYISKVFGLCERCKKPGYILHHKISLTPENINDPYITLNHDLLEYLCLECHNAVDADGVTRNDLVFNSAGDLVKR